MSVMIGDTRQYGAVKASAPFEMLQKLGMKTATMDTILRQETESLLNVAKRFSKGDFHGDFKAMGDNLQQSADYIVDGANAHLDDLGAGRSRKIPVF